MAYISGDRYQLTFFPQSIDEMIAADDPVRAYDVIIDKIFEEVMGLVNDYMKTEAYGDFLIKCIQQAVHFAGRDPVTLYINPSDESKRSDLEDATGVHLTISAEDFIGGVRAVIRSRNILIDNSFKTQLRNEYDKFIFLGGDGNA